MHRDQLETPVLVIDLDKMEENIRDMQAAMDASGVKLRPHTKTHKTPEIARKQIDAGAQGITVAKLGEAEVMNGSGIEDIFIAYPLVGEDKYRRLEGLMDRCAVRSSVDTVEGASMLSGSMMKRGRRADVLIKVDVGNGRCGRAPGEPTIALAQEVSKMKGLHLIGLFAHEGQAGGGETYQDVLDLGVKSVSPMVETAERLREMGIPVQEVSVGATPAAKGSCTVKGVTEARPGTYIFYDINCLVTGVVPPERCAASVICTVVSRPVPDRIIVDGGRKSFASDTNGRWKGHGLLKGRNDVIFDRMSEEHGVLEVTDPSCDLKIGDRVEIIPIHICTAVNLWDELVGLRGDRVELTWPVRARGKVR